jgi:NADH-quinone oxidoreductase subunit L
MVNAGVYLVARTYPMFVDVTTPYGSWVFWVAMVGSFTAIFTAVLALVERDLKRVLAYSTVSQLGYMMAAVGLGSVVAASFHLVSHAIFKALLFLCAGAIIHAAGTRDMYEMGGLRKEMKLTFVAFMVGALALAGIPPLNGFWSKDLIIETATESNTGTGMPFIFLGLAAILTAFYTVRMVMLVFYGPKRNPNKAHDAPASMSVPLVVLAAGALASWLAINTFSASMANSLMDSYDAEALKLGEVAEEMFLNPLIIIAIIAILLFLWFWHCDNQSREWFHKVWTKTRTGSMVWLIRKGFLFDDLYLAIIGGLKSFANKFRKLQTGDLNYNIMGAAIAFLLLVAILYIYGGI